jgi:hypothetical protein
MFKERLRRRIEEKGEEASNPPLFLEERENF